MNRNPDTLIAASSEGQPSNHPDQLVDQDAQDAALHTQDIISLDDDAIFDLEDRGVRTVTVVSN